MHSDRSEIVVLPTPPEPQTTTMRTPASGPSRVRDRGGEAGGGAFFCRACPAAGGARRSRRVAVSAPASACTRAARRDVRDVWRLESFGRPPGARRRAALWRLRRWPAWAVARRRTASGSPIARPLVAATSTRRAAVTAEPTARARREHILADAVHQDPRQAHARPRDRGDGLEGLGDGHLLRDGHQHDPGVRAEHRGDAFAALRFIGSLGSAPRTPPAPRGRTRAGRSAERRRPPGRGADRGPPGRRAGPRPASRSCR